MNKSYKDRPWDSALIGEFNGFTIVLSCLIEPIQDDEIEEFLVNELGWTEEQASLAQTYDLINTLQSPDVLNVVFNAYKDGVEVARTCATLRKSGKYETTSDIIGDGNVAKMLAGMMPNIIKELVGKAEEKLSNQ